MELKQQSIGMENQVGHDKHYLSSKNGKKKESNDNHGKEELKSFAQDTTLHGARFLFTENAFRRFIWTLVFIACLCYCIFQAYTTVVAFRQWPFITKISTSTKKENNELHFPAVSLCNLNAVNVRRFRDTFKTPSNGPVIERKIHDLSLMTTGSNEINEKEFVKRNPEIFHRAKTPKTIHDTQRKVSHQIDEMLLPNSSQFYSCSINGMPCIANNFTSHISSAYGQCYTFNSAENDHPLLNATLAGQNSGLKLRLNIERDSYIATRLRPAVGLAIIVHDQKSFPFMEEFGIAIQPGVSTLCTIKRKKIINLPAPYATNCTNRSLDMFNSDVYAYTKKACLIKCRNDYTIKRCGCTPPEFKANAPICAPNDTVLCVIHSYEEFGISSEKVACEKSCPEPCELVEYETSFSYSALQTETLVDHLMDFLNDTENKSVDRAIYEPLLDMTKSEREKYIGINIIDLKIYFEDLSYQIITQTPVYERWTVIAFLDALKFHSVQFTSFLPVYYGVATTGNLGGTFGLFLGMSVLTVLEFLDFIFRQICYLLRGKRKTGAIHVES